MKHTLFHSLFWLCTLHIHIMSADWETSLSVVVSLELYFAEVGENVSLSSHQTEAESRCDTSTLVTKSNTSMLLLCKWWVLAQFKCKCLFEESLTAVPWGALTVYWLFYHNTSHTLLWHIVLYESSIISTSNTFSSHPTGCSCCSNFKSGSCLTVRFRN